MNSVRSHLLFNARLQMVLVLVIVAALNLWSSQRFFRLDLTANNIHSLDPATRTLVGDLSKPLVAKVYFTGGLQAPYNNHEQVVVDTLTELAAYSQGKMRVEVIDPSGNAGGHGSGPTIWNSAHRLPLPHRWPQRASQGHDGVAFIYGERQASLPAISR